MHPRFAIRFFAALLVFLTAGPAVFALRTGDTEVVIPIVGRFPGAGGTVWRTDVFVANHTSVAKSLEITYHVAGGAARRVTAPLAAFSTATFHDIVLNTFELEAAAGELRLRSSNESGIEARARIYNVGHPAGEFGQNVPGLGRSSLSRQAYMFGLSGLDDNRVNVGVTNPNDSSTEVTLQIKDRTNTVLHTESFTLAPHQNVQFNDIFHRFGIGLQADVQVTFNTAVNPIYGYASEVRSDTGDAIFVAGTSPNS